MKYPSSNNRSSNSIRPSCCLGTRQPLLFVERTKTAGAYGSFLLTDEPVARRFRELETQAKYAGLLSCQPCFVTRTEVPRPVLPSSHAWQAGDKPPILFQTVKSELQ